MARPLTTLHFAQSLDGRLGLGRDRPRALLSSEEGVVTAHRARREHDAVLIGIETLLHDDPLLTARGEGSGQPLRVVLDSSLRTPTSSRIFTTGRDAGRVLVFASAERASSERRAALERAGADVRLTRADRCGRVSLTDALEALSQAQVKRLLVEGGARVLGSFLSERLADRAQIEIAPYFIGGPGTAALGDFSVPGLSAAPRLEQVSVDRLGQSVLLRGAIAYPEQEG